MVDVEHAVEVIGLVAHGPGHEAFAPHLALLAVAIEVSQLDALRPRDALGEIRNREAAFVVRLLPFGFDDLRIDADVQLAGSLADGEVDHHQPLRDADLVRGEPDARRGIHRLDHVVDELLQ